MASVVITNLTAAKLPLPELYIELGATGAANVALGPIDNCTVSMPTTRLTAMPALQALLAAGSISVAVTPTSDELNSGLLSPPNSIQTGDIVAQAVTAPKVARLTAANFWIGQGAGSDVAPHAMSGDATMTAGGVVTVSGVSASGMSDLASTANAKGASLIGLEAISGLTAATVQAAVAELLKYEPIALADPGTGVAIPVTKSVSVPLVIGSAGAETNSLAIPTFIGQRLILTAKTCGTGTRAVTSASAINVAGNTHMTFSAALQTIELVGVQRAAALGWQVRANDNVALT